MQNRLYHTKKAKKKRGGISLTWLLAGVFLLLSWLGLFLSGHVSGFANAWSRCVYRPLSQLAAFLWGWISFSLTEILVYGVLLYAIVGFFFALFRALRSRRRSDGACAFKPLRNWLRRIACLAALAFFLYVCFCGINYHRDSFSRENGIVLREYSTEELTALCRYLASRINESADTAAEDNVGVSTSSPMPGETKDCAQNSLSMLHLLGREAKLAMEKLGNDYPGLDGRYPRPKYLLNSRLLSVQQLTGIYSPFTIEANYNREIPWYNLPFTMCHELSHLRGYMQEEEANFIAFLSCVSADNAYFRYAGYLSAWVYCGNALAASDPTTFSQIYSSLPYCARADLSYNNAFWERFESPVAEAATQMNDNYLKANGQTEGVVSYDRVTGLILYYFTENKLPETAAVNTKLK